MFRSFEEIEEFVLRNRRTRVRMPCFFRKAAVPSVASMLKPI